MFSNGNDGKEVFYGINEGISEESLTVYVLTQIGEISVTHGSENPIAEDSLGHFIAALPVAEMDLDGDGETEQVYYYARADFGSNPFNPAPQSFMSEEIPFELVV